MPVIQIPRENLKPGRQVCIELDSSHRRAILLLISRDVKLSLELVGADVAVPKHQYRAGILEGQ